MNIKICFFIIIFTLSSINAYCQSDRDSAIQKELDYFEQHPNAINHPSVNTPSPSSFLNNRVHTFSLNEEIFYNHYAEPNKVRKDTGGWDGIEGQYIFRAPQGNILDTPLFNYYAIEGLYAAGKNTVSQNILEGDDINYTKLIIKNIPGYMFENRILLGKDFIPLPSLRLTPYTGFGIRYKTDQSSGRLNILNDGYNTPVLGWDFSEIYYYIPTGLTIDLATNHRYTISMNLEYDYLVKAYQNDDYSDFDSYTLPNYSLSNQNLRYSQNHGWGFRSSLKFLKHYSLFDLYFEPYLRYWDIKASKIASGFVGGPNFVNSANKNSTVEAGSKFGIEF